MKCITIYAKRTGAGKNFYSQRIAWIENVQPDDMLKAAREIMDLDKISTIKIGRL